MIVSVFLFPFFFQFSIQYVGGKLYLFVTGIYILPFGWLNSDLKKNQKLWWYWLKFERTSIGSKRNPLLSSTHGPHFRILLGNNVITVACSVSTSHQENASKASVHPVKWPGKKGSKQGSNMRERYLILIGTCKTAPGCSQEKKPIFFFIRHKGKLLCRA